MARISTKAGDRGDTRLADGTLVKKSALRVEAYGTVDELNSFIGLAAVTAGGKLKERLRRIQGELLVVGSDLATPLEKEQFRIEAAAVERLDKEEDEMEAALPPLKRFILPGGSETAARLHAARAVCRRAERLAVALSEKEEVNPEALKYLNRLSDWLFLAARMADGESG